MKNTAWPPKKDKFVGNSPQKMQPRQIFFMSLQKTVQMERKWEQNADFVKLLANFRMRLIIMSDMEYPNALGGF